MKNKAVPSMTPGFVRKKRSSSFNMKKEKYHVLALEDEQIGEEALGGDIAFMNAELLGRMERFLENELEKTKHGLKKIKRMIKTAIGSLEDELVMRRRLVRKFFLKNLNRDALIAHEEELKELEQRAEEPDNELVDPQLNIVGEPNADP